MAPTALDVERQTRLIVKYLLQDEDEEEICERTLRSEDGLEVDSPGAAASDDDNFDAVLIADKLRSVADDLNDDLQFKAALSDLKKAAAQQAFEAAFSRGVEAVNQTHVAQKAEVAPEMQLIKASVAFGLYVKQSAPELKNKVYSAMTAFLNRRVGSWVTEQGGWEPVTGV